MAIASFSVSKEDCLLQAEKKVAARSNITKCCFIKSANIGLDFYLCSDIFLIKLPLLDYEMLHGSGNKYLTSITRYQSSSKKTLMDDLV